MAKKVEKEVEETKVEKKSTKKSGKSILPYIIIAVGLIAVFVVILFFTKGGNSSLEDKLSTSLTKMGEEFYTEFYYPEISRDKTTAEITESLEKFKDIGIKINLDNLERYNDGANKEEIAKFKNEKGTECNKTTTRAVIYPKAPYGKNDYTVKAELDCGFETETK